MNYYQWLINQRAAEKRARFIRDADTERGGRVVHFDEWCHVEHGVFDPMQLDRLRRRYLYEEYQQAMIEMHFVEWDAAKAWGVPSFVNLFGR